MHRSLALVPFALSLGLFACTTHDGPETTGSAASALGEPPTWVCCSFTCTTSGGQTHPTDACHPSSISTDCPAMPAQGDAAEQCELVAVNAAESCDVCVNGLHGR